jgi:diguanylate cyclase (GGDEF)-like protein
MPENTEGFELFDQFNKILSLVWGLGEMQVELRARLKAASRIRFLKRDLEKAARTDPLTGLFHRTTFFQRATLEWDRSERTGYPLSVVMFDCDFFKRVNDRHGHAAGDEVLRELVARVRKGCRKEDVFCRYGGEEFCVLLPRMNEKEAKQWAERIRKTVASEAIRIAPTEELTVTASFGVAQKTDALLDIDQLVAQADQALLAAKELGRNRTVCYTETIAEEHPLKQAIGVEEAIFARMTAREVMSPIFHSINKDESVASVVDFFLQTRFGALPVVNEDGSLFGIISERNFLGMAGEEHRWHQSIQDLVNQYVISFPDETPIRGIIEFLGRVPLQEVVIVENNRPIGMISRNLLLRWRWNRWLASLTSYREKCSRGDGKAGVLQEVREKIKFLTSDL